MSRSVIAHLFASLLTGLSMIGFAWIALISIFSGGLQDMTPWHWIIAALVGAMPFLIIGIFIHYLCSPSWRSLLSTTIASGIPLVFGFVVTASHQTFTTHWSSGPYQVYEIDPGSGIEFGIDLGGGLGQGLVDAPVSGVGEDDRWIVIHRSSSSRDPAYDRYFYLPKRSDDPKKSGSSLLKGPFDKATFDQQSAELNLPPISHTFP